MKRILIVGGVAGGATAAARARRISEDAEITIVERGKDVSFANCGLPYYVSRDIEKRSRLLLQTPEGFLRRYRVHVLTETEATRIDRDRKVLTVTGPKGETQLEYDSLILAQGSQPIVPRIPGIPAPHVFTLWTLADMDRLDSFIDSSRPATAVVVGGGFIGLEAAEALSKRGVSTTIVEMQPSIMPQLDPEFGNLAAKCLVSNGVRVVAGVSLNAVHPGEVELSDGARLPADCVLLAIGARPNVSLATAAGLPVGSSGGLLVDEHMRTADPSIYAAGDMVEIVQRVTGRKVRIPLAGPANRQGRIAASNALGLPMKYAGGLGTSVVKVFGSVVAFTGLTETAARDAGFDAGTAVVVKGQHAGYYPGAKEMILKVVYDRGSSRLLGAQAIGEDGVEKRIDVLSVALRQSMCVDELAELDLSYAPPFSSANDPVNQAGFVASNDLTGFSPLVGVRELKEILSDENRRQKYYVVDVRTPEEFESSHLDGAVNFPLEELREVADEVPRSRPIILHCKSGFRAHLALRILREKGFKEVRNLTGGYMMVEALGGFRTIDSSTASSAGGRCGV
jgi:NADPH-dependent 2,4-dienoyl-CoA reductase/sulfur reductase-like enzyme/rhodanese-related sulfurtransferase